MAGRFLATKGPLITACIGAASLGLWTYTTGYPANRELYMSYFKINEADGYTVKRIEEAYNKLQESTECNSLLKKHLTKEIKDKLKYKKSKLGGTLLDVIRSGKLINKT
jgi:hypothetical protein